MRTSRFFPEADDRDDVRAAYEDANLKVNELLYRRVDLEDVVDAHRLAIERAPGIGFGRYIISATTPFGRTTCRICGRKRRRLCGATFPTVRRSMPSAAGACFRPSSAST